MGAFLFIEVFQEIFESDIFRFFANKMCRCGYKSIAAFLLTSLSKYTHKNAFVCIFNIELACISLKQ